jgi:predicted transcriptional regulator
MNNPTEARSAITQLTTDIVAAYVSNNSIPESNLPDIIRSVHKTMQEVENPQPAAPAEEPTTKISSSEIKKSITHDGLISFVDGKRYKTLKRHLTMHSLTPEQYRTKFGLPRDYPMTAKSYSEQRASLARALGLGRRNRMAQGEAESATSAQATQPTAAPETPAAKPARGGRRKAEAAPTAPTEAKTPETKAPAARGRKVKAAETQVATPAPKKTARKTKAAAAKADGAKTTRAKGGRTRKGKGSAEASASA